MILTDNTQRLLRIEAKLDAVLKHLGIQFDPREEIAKLANNHDKIGAIRLHRSCFNSNLAAAKKEVEKLASGK
jgi:hypothetical protein